MTRLIISLIYMLYSFNGTSQNLISTAGQSTNLGGFEFTYSIGELITTTLEGPLSVTQGFCQPYVDELNSLKSPKSTTYLKIYPNPLSGEDLYIEYLQDKIYYIQVVNIFGQVVYENKIGTEHIQLKGIFPGLYIVSVYTDSNVFLFSNLLSKI